MQVKSTEGLTRTPPCMEGGPFVQRLVSLEEEKRTSKCTEGKATQTRQKRRLDGVTEGRQGHRQPPAAWERGFITASRRSPPGRHLGSGLLAPGTGQPNTSAASAARPVVLCSCSPGGSHSNQMRFLKLLVLRMTVKLISLTNVLPTWRGQLCKSEGALPSRGVPCAVRAVKRLQHIDDTSFSPHLHRR